MNIPEFKQQSPRAAPLHPEWDFAPSSIRVLQRLSLALGGTGDGTADALSAQIATRIQMSSGAVYYDAVLAQDAPAFSALVGTPDGIVRANPLNPQHAGLLCGVLAQAGQSGVVERVYVSGAIPGWTGAQGTAYIGLNALPVPEPPVAAWGSVMGFSPKPGLFVVQVESVLTAPPGPASPGLSGSTYLYQQSAPSAVWNITHNLGFYPAVVIMDTAGSVVTGDIRHTDANHLTLSFSAPFSGQASLT